MTSTLDHRKSAPLPLGGMTTSYDDDTDSLGSSVPEVIDLRVILPDGTEKITSVNSSKQMLDLAVMLSASNRLSPANHTLAIYHPEHGRPIEFKASQMIGALRVDTVHLVNKKANKDKTKRHTVAQPFEMTNRVSVNLPKNQKTVIRISPHSTLADIFKMVCKEKGLDPYKHELRHPTQPDMALNMASPLSSYNITDISVVNVTAPDQVPSTGGTGTVKASIYDTHWTYNNSMPRNKAEQQPPPGGNTEQQASAYMPGMTEKKKKKGIMSIFSRKKEGKFRLSDATFTAPSTSSQPNGHDIPVTNGNKPQAEVKPQPQQPPPATLRVETSTTSLKTAEPKKPQRKKRQAPAPPSQPGGTKPLSVNTETTPTNSSKPHGIHSRGSSHSSGFDETNMSPLESPGGSSGKSSNNTTASSGHVKHGAESGSSDSSGIVGDGQVREPVIKLSVTGEVHVSATNVSRHSSMSTGANSSTSSLSRGKKKRMAPAPPPPGGSKPSSATTSPSHSAASRSDGSSTHHSPREAPPSDDELDVRELQMAIAEELKNEVSSCDTVTDGEEPDTPGIHSGDLTLQTDVQMDDVTGQRELLQRQKSDVAVFVDQMTELTHKVQHESNEVHHVQINAVEEVHNSSEVFAKNELDTQRPFPEIADIQIHTNSEANNKKLSIVSDSSSDVGSLSKFKFDNETDSDTEDVHNRTVSPVMEDIVVPEKKKIVPAFKLEFGEDDVLGENLSEPETGHFENHRTKSIDVHAILNAFDKIEELEETDIDSHSVSDTEIRHIDTDDVYAAQHVDESTHVTTIRISEDDFHNNETEEWVQSDWLPMEGDTADEQKPKSPESRQSEEEWVHSEWITDQKPTSPESQKSAEEWVHSEWITDQKPISPESQKSEEDWVQSEWITMEDDMSSKQKTDSGGDEINVDSLDVTYVNPHHSDDHSSGTQAHVPLDEIERSHLHMGKHVPEVELSTVVRPKDAVKLVIPEITDRPSSGLSTPTGSPRQDEKVKVTPPRSSLYSIISGVKSSKAENRKTTSVVDVPKTGAKDVKVKQELSTFENKIEVSNSIVFDKQTERQEPEKKNDPEVKVEPKAPEPIFTSLRDAYRNKQAKEPETLIFPKPEPYKIPTVSKKDRQSVSAGHSGAHSNTSIQEETKVSSVEKTTSPSTDTQGHAIVYNAASLAVSRKAPKVKSQEYDDSADHQSTRYWGPRPWSARSSPDLSSDLSSDANVVKISPNKTEKSTTPQKEPPSSVIGMYSPGKSPSKVESSPKDKCTEISFSPKSEEEDGHHIHEMMEDKSISMLAYPVERKSVLRTTQTNRDVARDSRQYNSSMNLSSSANDAEFKTNEAAMDSRMYSSSSGLSEIGKDPNQNTEAAAVKPIIKNSTRYDAQPVANTKDKAKKNLQQQYTDLQGQFSKWQRQLMDNQALLAQKNVAPVDKVDGSEGVQHAGDTQPPAKQLPEVHDAILQKQLSLDALEQKRAAETYRRLNTPLPFSHKPTDPQGFVPRPIMKKRFSYDERLQTSNDRGATNKTPSGSVDSFAVAAKISPADLKDAKGALRQNSYNDFVENSSTMGVGGSQQLMRMASVDSRNSDDIPMTPDEVVHRTLCQTKSEPSKPVAQPPPAPLLNNNSLTSRKGQGSSATSRNDSRFGPKLDPREELMIAIRNANGGKHLQRSSSVEADW